MTKKTSHRKKEVQGVEPSGYHEYITKAKAYKPFCEAVRELEYETKYPIKITIHQEVRIKEITIPDTGVLGHVSDAVRFLQTISEDQPEPIRRMVNTLMIEERKFEELIVEVLCSIVMENNANYPERERMDLKYRRELLTRLSGPDTIFLSADFVRFFEVYVAAHPELGFQNWREFAIDILSNKLKEIEGFLQTERDPILQKTSQKDKE